MPDIVLVPIDPDGTPRGFAGAVPRVALEALAGTAALYVAVGFQEPWVGYLALDGEVPVGTCGFKSPPVDGRVEIAYFTFPEHEGRGVATAMAAELAALARQHVPGLVVAAQTLPERGASARILEKLGFLLVGTVEHPEDGPVWEWRLGAAPDTGGRPTA